MVGWSPAQNQFLWGRFVVPPRGALYFARIPAFQMPEAPIDPADGMAKSVRIRPSR